MFRNKILKFILLVGSIVGFNQAYSDIEWEILDLGTLETEGSEACCVNDKGQICGTYHFLGKKNYYLWEEGKGTICLDLPEGAVPFRMNNLGQIIGSYEGENKRCFFWDPVQGVIDIISPLGRGIVVTGINDHGQVVGSFQTAGKNISNWCWRTLDRENAELQAFFWEKGVMTELANLRGELCLKGNISGATAINNDGLIVGYSSYGILYKGKPFNSPLRAVVWENGKIREIAPNSDSKKQRSVAFAVNNLGCVLFEDSGFYELDVKSGKITKWNQNRTINDIHYKLSESGFFNSPIRAISFEDHFVNKPDSIWISVHLCVDSNNSNWVVGTATNIYNETHAVLLRPINPLDDQLIDSEKISGDSELESFEGKKLISGLSKELQDLKELQNVHVKYGNNTDGCPVLHEAIKKGDKRAVELLLEHGAEVNSTDTVFTALHYAALKNQVEIARLLLDNGANVQAAVSYKALPTQLANQLGINFRGLTPIHLAAHAGNAEMVELVHEKGADLNKKALISVDKDQYGQMQDKWGDTPLFLAAQAGHYDAVVALVTLGADVNVMDSDTSYFGGFYAKNTPLGIAARVLKYEKDPKNLELVKFLVEHGAKRDSRIYRPEDNNPRSGDASMCPVISGYLKGRNL